MLIIASCSKFHFIPWSPIGIESPLGGHAIFSTSCKQLTGRNSAQNVMTTRLQDILRHGWNLHVDFHSVCGTVWAILPLTVRLTSLSLDQSQDIWASIDCEFQIWVVFPQPYGQLRPSKCIKNIIIIGVRLCFQFVSAASSASGFDSHVRVASDGDFCLKISDVFWSTSHTFYWKHLRNGWSDWRETTRGASVGFWVNYVTLTFDLTHDLVVGYSKLKFITSCISGMKLLCGWYESKTEQIK